MLWVFIWSTSLRNKQNIHLASPLIWSYETGLFNLGPAEPKHVLPFANSVDPDQLASEEANWSGSALFVIK